MSSNTANNRVMAWVRAEVRRLHAYHVPPAHGMIKLDAMENPYTLPTALKQQWLEQIATVEINRYPDAAATALKAQLAAITGVDTKQLMVGNGSDELIQMLLLLTAGNGRSIVAPTPSFSMYQIIAAITASQFIGVPLEHDFSLDRSAMLAAIRRYNPACVFIAWPNNPTGNCCAVDAIIDIIDATSGLVILDEAYYAFSRRSFIDRLNQHDNLMVLRTLSKSGLAGLRLGYLAAQPVWIKQLEKIRLPYNINSLTQVSATFVLKHADQLDLQISQIIEQRSVLFAALSALPGIEAFASESNFILIRVKGLAELLYDYLKNHNVLIKNLHQPATALADCLRITVGTAAECRALLEHTKNFLRS